MALITHVRYHATDGVIEAWIYDGNALTKVMEWNKNTVWNAAGSEDGHDFYTFSRNGNSANQLQVNAYWNGWTGYVGTKYAWISNVIIATSFDDVASYLGVSSNDTASPARTNPSPNGTLPSGTTSTNISLTTDKQAICRYSNISDTNYTDMEYNFTDTNSTNHSTLVTGLENGQTYTFYVRCNSTEGYVNDDDFNISFSIGGHKADLNDDGIINMPELISFIARWKACDGVSKEEVEEARDIWFTGGVY
ncbi:MAG: hypothetical protein U9M95_00085 [Candidatus Altiarchaeota archaeon]|nr:hypothetical protein [Candidatus Altiarchaeota archaeon]